MITARIRRGAARTAAIASYEFRRLLRNRPTAAPRAGRAALLTALTLRTVLMPVPLHAAVAAGGTDTESEPPSRPGRASGALGVTAGPDGLTVVVRGFKLGPVETGSSIADDEAAAEAVRQAETMRLQAVASAMSAARAQPAAVGDRSIRAYAGDIGDIQQIILNAAAEYGVDGNLMLRIADCESGFRPDARNRGGSSATGLFQFMPGTYGNSPQARDGLSIYDPAANAGAAAFKIANGALSAWNASRHCWAN